MMKEIVSLLRGQSIILRDVSESKCELRVGRKIGKEKLKMILASALKVSLL